jgi:hypothetical protein
MASSYKKTVVVSETKFCVQCIEILVENKSEVVSIIFADNTVAVHTIIFYNNITYYQIKRGQRKILFV